MDGLAEHKGIPGLGESLRFPWWRSNWYGKCAYHLQQGPRLNYSPAGWEAGEWCREVLVRDPCVYCGGTVETIDHIVAVSRGGEDEIENFAAVCWPCNALKSAKPVLHMMLRRMEIAEHARVVALPRKAARADEISPGDIYFGFAGDNGQTARVVARIVPSGRFLRLEFENGSTCSFAPATKLAIASNAETPATGAVTAIECLLTTKAPAG